MYIHGEFLDRQGRTVAVHIVTGGDYTEELEIGTSWDAVLQFTDNPVEIDCSVNDCFDHIISHSATIHLQTRAFIEPLFCSSPLEGAVNIMRDGECLFCGFIEPMSYSQDFVEVYDDFDIECIDVLSALQHVNYGGVGMNGVDYDEQKETVGNVCLFEVLTGELSALMQAAMTTAVSESTLYFDGRLLFAAGGDSVFRYATFHDTLFYGSIEDDLWTYENITEEFLKYCNLHITQIGATFVVFTWEGVRAGFDDWQSYQIAGEAASTMPVQAAITLSTDNVADMSTNISVLESYSHIALTCSIEDIDTLVGSMLDEDTLYSGYDKAQLYLREIVEEEEEILSSRESWDEDTTTTWLDAWLAFVAMVLDYDSLTGAYDGSNRTSSSRYASDAWWQDWYIKPMLSTVWDVCPSSFSSDSERSEVVGVLKEDAETAGGALIVSLQDLLKYPGAAFFVQVGSEAKHYLNSSDATISTRDDETVLVFNVGGNGIQSYYSEESEDPDDDGATITTEYVPYPLASDFANMPMLSLAQVTEGNYTPDDSSITNYIVISGNLRLVGFKKTANGISYAQLHSELVDEYGTDDDTGALTDAEYDAEGGYYPPYARRRYEDDGSWKGVTSTKMLLPPSEAYTTHNVQVLAATREHPIGSPYSPYNSDDAVHMRILGCFLSVGNKCVNETSDGVYEWVEFDESDMQAAAENYHFFIKVQVDVDADVIDSALSIANEVTTAMNIDADGMAIPITYDDALSGEVKFYFLAPCNPIFTPQAVSDANYDEDTTPYAVYAGADFLTDSKDWAGTEYVTAGGITLLPVIDSIQLSEFEINIYSDNGKVEESSLLTTSNDVVYQSTTNETFNNKKDDIDFAMSSGLTAAEARAMGVLTTVNQSTVRDASGKALLTAYDDVRGVEAKPELFYIDSYYNECHEPQVEMEQTVIDADGMNILSAFFHPALDKTFHVMGISRSLIGGEATITLKSNNDD